MADPLDAARGIAEELLFPRALETDALPVVPVENLDALADAGLYGLTGPTEAGGLGADFGTVCAVVEALASGCLTTAFVYAQHLGAVHAVASSETPALADEWLRPLCSGARRAGLALAGALPGPPLLRAEPSDGAWSLTGAAPWVSGIGRVDVIHTAARTPEDDVIWLLADAADSAVRAKLLELLAVGATATARVDYDGFRVGGDRVTSIVPHEGGPPNPYVLRIHAALVLGVVDRACRLLGPTALDTSLAACRSALDGALAEEHALEMPAARAAASELALRATAALMARTGSRSVLRTENAQRLAREALFLAVYGSRPEVRSSLLASLGAEAP